ncbi:MAG: arginine--tRNA ligase [Clostridia bacterium]|nr:arginine--tRNA ligase [Clostridia bacterium]
MERAEAVSGYLNLFFNRARVNEAVLSLVSDSNKDKRVLGTKNSTTRGSEEGLGQSLGSVTLGRGKTVLIEFSSPNIAKPFHVGHLYSTVIGNSIERIYKHLGYNTVRINHLGDWGTQFGKLITAYLLWGDDEKLTEEPIQELLRIYVMFHKEAERNPALEDEARRWFKKLEEDDPQAKALWTKFSDLSLKAFNKLYDRLGITFDSYAGESFYSDKMDEVVSLLDQKGLLAESDNAKVVNLEAYSLPPCLIVKSDGATIYATRDLAAALYRKRTYDFDKCLYVVGTPQALHFQQVFHVLELAGFAWYRDCVHIGFGLVRFADRKLATRTGDVIFLEDVLNESVKRSLALIEENNPALENKQETAEKVGIGAIMFAFLKSGRERDIVFSWEEMLNNEGESGPYLQYTYARAQSILKKSGIPDQASCDTSLLVSDEEFAIVKLLDSFQYAVVDAAEKYEPSILARHALNLSRAFNRFYNHCPVLSAEPELRKARLWLIRSFCAVLETELELLGMKVCKQM